jgi:acyl-coenzyme A thioesterase PaaI-like protein
MKESLYRLMKPKWVRRFFNIWPVFMGAGIRINDISEDFRYSKVSLKFHWWNKNANRSQYGGSMFSMTDPIYPFMLMGVLGSEYLIWDSEAKIRFIKPGRSKLTAEFILEQNIIDQIKQATAHGNKYFPKFVVVIKDAKGEVVAEIERTLYVRKRLKTAQALPQSKKAA